VNEQVARDDAAVCAVVEAVAGAPAFRAAESASAALADALDASAVVLWQVDYVMLELHAVGRWPATRTDETGSEETAAVNDTPLGAVFRTQEPVEPGAADGSVLLLPLTSRGHRIGVVEVSRSAGWPASLRRRAIRCVAMLAPLLWEAGRGDDLQERRRRSTRLSLPAEMQWQLLQTRGLVVPDRFSVFAQLEPAELVSSDLYEWSYDGRLVTVAVLDAAGEGIRAAQASELALTALRNARRAPVDLLDSISLADQALWDEFRGRAEVAALVLEHDVDAGITTVVRAGTPPPMIWRAGGLHTLTAYSDAPLGVAELSPYRGQEVEVAPGDVVLLLTDGALTARNARGTVFGTAGLISVLQNAELPDWEIPRAVVHGVREHVGSLLPDDATCVALRLIPTERPDLMRS
jgi:hypothetical protein